MGLGGGEMLLILMILALPAGLIVGAILLARYVIISGIVTGVSQARSQAPAAATQLRVEKVCPDCAESVLAEARVCKHCGFRFEPKV
jgi:hypothetical protein